MNKTGFHEWPLVAFSTLATAGAGMLAAQAVGWAGGWPPAPRDTGLAAALLLAAALAVSIAHLGQRMRLAQALRAVGQSALSNEVTIAGAAFGAALLLAWSVGEGAVDPWAGVLSIVTGLALLVALGLVYRLAAVPSWMGASALAPLGPGLVAGTLWHLAPQSPAGGLPPWPLVVVVALDGGLLALRWRQLDRAAGTPRRPWLFSNRAGIFSLRVGLIDLAPPAILMLGFPVAALVSVGVGLLLDRWAFYALAVSRTVESQIAEVESLIAAR